ncbi:MAG TPA: septation protein SepH [Mycobacteriales bacterium]|jgi:hypothetical protein|nr:septation protein SepH [Mycobacteriales bacterium]
MRPVRFVALAEDGQALVLRDEAGRILTLALDETVTAAIRRETASTQGQLSNDMEPALSPRDIQAKIRSGDSAEEVARRANVPMEKVLRFAGPVLQERAAVAQMARHTRLRTSEDGATLSAVVDARLSGHGVDTDSVVWDAYRKDDGTWRVTASWPSGKATAHAYWDLDKPRSVVSPGDDMAQYLSTETPPTILAQDDPPPAPAPWVGLRPRDMGDNPTMEIPVVPSLSLLRPRRVERPGPVPAVEPEQPVREAPDLAKDVRPDTAARVEAMHEESLRAAAEEDDRGPRSPELPSWDDILFGTRRNR